MKTMRRLFLLLMLSAAVGAGAQQSLVGRVYYNKNVMEKVLNDALGEDAEKRLIHMRDSTIRVAEQKKGRKLTAEERAQVDKEIEKGQKMVEAVKKGVSTAITVEFKSETEMVMKADMKVDDEVLKAAGVPWAKRKLMKAALAIMPAEKYSYVRQGNLVISIDGKDRDTLTLSDDGKYLSGRMDAKTPFKLTRTK